MSRLGLAGAEVLEVVEPGSEAGGNLGDGVGDDLAQQVRVALGAEVDDELAAFDGGLEIGSQLGYEVVAHQIDDGAVAAVAVAVVEEKCSILLPWLVD